MKQPIAILLLLVMLVPGAAMAEDNNFRASLGLSQEYNDNVQEVNHGKGDFVTTLKPNLAYTYNGPRLLFDTSYQGEFAHYLDGVRNDGVRNNLNLLSRFAAVQDFLFLEVTDTYQTIYQDVTRGDATGATGTVQQVNQNIFGFSPYTVFRFGQRGNLKTGWRFQDIQYDGQGVDKTQNIGFADAKYELTDKWAAEAGYSITRQDSEQVGYVRQVPYVGARYQYAEDSYRYLHVGESFTQNDGQKAGDPRFFWEFGGVQTFGSVSVEAVSAVKYEDDPLSGGTYERQTNSLSLTKKFKRTRLGLYGSYDHYEGGSRGTTETTRVGFTLNHELSARLSGSLDVSRQLQDGSISETERWEGGVGLKYLLSEEYVADLWYRVKNAYATGSNSDRDTYRVNRIGLQLTRTFY